MPLISIRNKKKSIRNKQHMPVQFHCKVLVIYWSKFFHHQSLSKTRICLYHDLLIKCFSYVGIGHKHFLLYTGRIWTIGCTYLSVVYACTSGFPFHEDYKSILWRVNQSKTKFQVNKIKGVKSLAATNFGL